MLPEGGIRSNSLRRGSLMWVRGRERVPGSSRAKEGSSHKCELARGLFPRLGALSSLRPRKPDVAPHLAAPIAAMASQVVKNPPANTGGIMRLGFHPWIGMIPWRRAWQPTPVFLPGESHGQRSLVGYSPWGRRVRHNWSDLAHMHSCSGARGWEKGTSFSEAPDL